MSEYMPKIDKEKLKEAHQQFIKVIEKENLERVHRLQALNRRNVATGLTLGLGVLAIYGYSMWAVKQENFLDDFDPPQTETHAKN